MFNMNCPSCGAAGRVPENKINARLHCKKCLAVFHLTAMGNPVLGPPAPAPEAREPGRRKDDHREEEVEQLLTNLKDLPQKLIKPAMILASLLLIYVLYLFMAPTSLNTRATEAALALTNADPRALQDLSLPGTGAATLAWRAGVRERHKDFLGDENFRPKVQITNVNGDPSRGLAEVTAILSEPKTSSRARLASPDPSINHGGERAVEVRFVLSGGGLRGWRVDGERTLESHRRSVSRELAKTEPE